MLPPYPELADASAALGHNFLALDKDGPARRMAPFIRQGQQALPSLGLAAALMAEHLTAADVRPEGNGIRIRDRRLPLIQSTVVDPYDRTRHDQWTMLINYRAPAVLADGARPYRSYAFRRLFMSEQQLLAGEKPMVDPAEFKNTIVFIGLTGSGLIDIFNSPFGDDHMPGIQLHASMADSVLAGRFIAPASSSRASPAS